MPIISTGTVKETPTGSKEENTFPDLAKTRIFENSIRRLTVGCRGGGAAKPPPPTGSHILEFPRPSDVVRGGGYFQQGLYHADIVGSRGKP